MMFRRIAMVMVPAVPHNRDPKIAREGRLHDRALSPLVSREERTCPPLGPLGQVRFWLSGQPR